MTKKKKFYIFGLRTAENFRALCTGKTMLSFCKIHCEYLRDRETERGRQIGSQPARQTDGRTDGRTHRNTDGHMNG